MQKIDSGVIRLYHVIIAVATINAARRLLEIIDDDQRRTLEQEATEAGHKDVQDYVKNFVRERIFA